MNKTIITYYDPKIVLIQTDDANFVNSLLFDLKHLIFFSSLCKLDGTMCIDYVCIDKLSTFQKSKI